MYRLKPGNSSYLTFTHAACALILSHWVFFNAFVFSTLCAASRNLVDAHVCKLPLIYSNLVSADFMHTKRKNKKYSSRRSEVCAMALKQKRFREGDTEWFFNDAINSILRTCASHILPCITFVHFFPAIRLRSIDFIAIMPLAKKKIETSYIIYLRFWILLRWAPHVAHNLLIRCGNRLKHSKCG